jgi:hypothetical protein
VANASTINHSVPPHGRDRALHRKHERSGNVHREQKFVGFIFIEIPTHAVRSLFQDRHSSSPAAGYGPAVESRRLRDRFGFQRKVALRRKMSMSK